MLCAKRVDALRCWAAGSSARCAAPPGPSKQGPVAIANLFSVSQFLNSVLDVSANIYNAILSKACGSLTLNLPPAKQLLLP